MGTFIRDRITPWQGAETQSIGGMFFTVSYLANLVEPSVEIFPLAFVGADFKADLLHELRIYPNVSLRGLFALPRENTQVHLTYASAREREEVTTDPMPPLGREELACALDADVAIVNLITGCDVQLQALAGFRESSGALLYLDFHSHALGIDPAGQRYYRQPPDWREWLALTDVLQLNAMEACTLSGFSEEAPLEALQEFGLSILELGPSVCHITLEERGSLLCHKTDDQAQVTRIPGVSVPLVLDRIGCGDAFQAGYIAKYLQGAGVLEATQFAHKTAGLNCTFVGSSGIRDMRHLLLDDKADFSKDE